MNTQQHHPHHSQQQQYPHHAYHGVPKTVLASSSSCPQPHFNPTGSGGALPVMLRRHTSTTSSTGTANPFATNTTSATPTPGISNHPLMMMSPSTAAVAAAAAINPLLSHHTNPPLTSLLHNVTPEDILLAASINRRARHQSLVAAAAAAAVNAESLPMGMKFNRVVSDGGAPVTTNANNGLKSYHFPPFSTTATTTATTTTALRHIHENHSTAHNLESVPGMNAMNPMNPMNPMNAINERKLNICRDSLMDEDFNNDDDDESAMSSNGNNSFVSNVPSMRPPSLFSSSRSLDITQNLHVQNRNQSLNLNQNLNLRKEEEEDDDDDDEVQASEQPYPLLPHEKSKLLTRKRTLETILRREESSSNKKNNPLSNSSATSGVSAASSTSTAKASSSSSSSKTSTASSKPNYKSNGAGAASWNAAVRKDMNKVQVSKKSTSTSSPNFLTRQASRICTTNPNISRNRNTSTTVTEFLCDVCKDVAFPTYEEALKHEEECRRTFRKGGRKKNSIKSNLSLTSLSSSASLSFQRTSALPTTLLTRAVTDDGSKLRSASHAASTAVSNTAKLTNFSRDISDDFVSPTRFIRTVSEHEPNLRTTLNINKRPEEHNDDLVFRPPISEKKSSSSTKTTTTTTAASANKRILLATPEDKHWLSDLVCLIRENIEVFAATPEDVAARSRRGGIKKPIAVGRVGIRCIHCAHVSHDKKAKGAVSYPNSIRIVHQAVRNWQRYHFDACEHIPESVRKAYAALKSTRSHSGNASLKYWIDSTMKLGLVDTNAEDGIRFEKMDETLCVPCDESLLEQTQTQEDNTTLTNISTPSTQSPTNANAGTTNAITVTNNTSPTHHSTTFSQIDQPTNSSKHPQPSLVNPEDKNEITEFLYELLDQQQACEYKAVDRNGKRKFRTLGFPGVECKHCARNAGAGRYFPLMVTTLANNNNPFNCTHSHMMKCRRCPQEVKNRLAQLQKVHAEQGAKLPVGWKKSFFDKLWVRLHGTENKNHEDVVIDQDESPIMTTTTPTLPSHSVQEEEFDNDIDSAAQALSSFSAQAFSDAAAARAVARNQNPQ